MYTRCYVPSFKVIDQLFLMKIFLKVFTKYRHGGYVGHMTRTRFESVDGRRTTEPSNPLSSPGGFGSGEQKKESLRTK